MNPNRNNHSIEQKFMLLFILYVIPFIIVYLFIWTKNRFDRLDQKVLALEKEIRHLHAIAGTGPVEVNDGTAEKMGDS